MIRFIGTCLQLELIITVHTSILLLSWNKAPIWGLRPNFYYCQTVAGLLMWSALSDERTVVSFTFAAGPCQRSHSRVRVPWDSGPYFTASDSILPFSSPPTTHRVTVKVINFASTREWITCSFIIRCGPQTEHTLELFLCKGNACLPNRCSTTIYSTLPWECDKRSVALHIVTVWLSGVRSQYVYIYRREANWDFFFFYKLHGTTQRHCCWSIRPISSPDSYLYTLACERVLRSIVSPWLGLWSHLLDRYFFSVERSTLSIVFRVQCDRLCNPQGPEWVEFNLLCIFFISLFASTLTFSGWVWMSVLRTAHCTIN
jgi:hypothetical protein